MDFAARSPWDAPETVDGFARSQPNATLMAFADAELRRLKGRGRLLDLGCGAGRNAVPLAMTGWDVLAIDRSMPMLAAAVRRSAQEALSGRLSVALAPMDALPFGDQTMDLVVAHGIWNLARSTSEFRRAVGEAARVARPRAGLFVFTFSRHTLPPETTPVSGELFVFTQFAEHAQCFLTDAQLVWELARAGFEPDGSVPLREHNRPRPGALPSAARTPVIYEGAFRRAG